MNLNHDQLMKIGKAWAEGLTEALGDNSTEVNRENDDLIRRQAAIDVSRNETVSTNPDEFYAHDKFIKFQNNPEIVSYGRWQWSNGFNTALEKEEIMLKNLPSAEPEIIRCMDCVNAEERGCALFCGFWSRYTSHKGYCFKAERRTDE